jgi:hypothetical protein
MLAPVAVLRDNVGHWYFLSSDTHDNKKCFYQVFDVTGTNLLRSVTIDIDKEILVAHLRDTLGCVEWGLM